MLIDAIKIMTLNATKFVTLNLGRGTLQDGFPSVTVQLKSESNSKISQFHGSLPSSANILHLYRRWQLLYDLLYEARSIHVGLRKFQSIDDGIEFDEDDVTHISESDFYDVCNELQKEIDKWLDYEDFRNVDRQLRMRLNTDDEIRFIIQTEDNYLRKIPWHIWRFFRDYPRAEIALSAIEFDSGIQIKNYIKKVRILAVLGNSSGIDVEADKKLLSSLLDTKAVFLAEPSRLELDEKLWDEQGWDILFFAGHSSSSFENETGYLYINSSDKLSITQLRNALRKAIERGLQLAIFNSCDGLGLAQQLDDLHIPQMIIMREPVPDKVAQEFLKHFLNSFSKGKSLYLAFREAREKLQGLENEFPGASWLPVIFQNPAEKSPSWVELRDKKTKNSLSFFNPHQAYNNKIVKTILLVSLAVTTVVAGARSLGKIQAWELQAYDSFMAMRSHESPDKRIVIVGIKDSDLKLAEQKRIRPNTSISDEALEKLLEKLESFNPRVIGLDIIRDFPVDENYPKLRNRLQNSQKNKIYGACFVGGANSETHSIPAPPEIKNEYLGFMDILPDSDGVVRRHLLSMDLHPTSSCKADMALSIVLASHYLQQEPKGFQTYKNENGNWQIGNVTFHRLQIPKGGYQKADMWGNQIMLNYRSYRSADEIVDIVTLADIFQGKVNPELIKDKIVLVGVMTSKTQDKHLTPYNQNTLGVILHAQMVSQILSAVSDGRPLIWTLPLWGEILWIWGWSIISGLLAWRTSSLYNKIIVTGVAITILFAICHILFQPQISCWMPLVPAVFAFGITQGTFVVLFIVKKINNLAAT